MRPTTPAPPPTHPPPLQIVTVDVQTLQTYNYGQEYPQRVYLIFDGTHYDPLALDGGGEGGSADVRVFPTDDAAGVAVSLEQAMNVAREAYAARQFSTAGDTIRCLTCQETFVGQNAAVEHAKATGHTNFGAI